MQKSITLNNGTIIPTIGLGVYQMSPGLETEQAVHYALKAGYRLIDTAAFYRNEKDVGNAIKKSGIPRQEIFVTTKLYPTTFFNIEKAFSHSLNRLGLDYIDLYLVHWPFLRKNKIWKILEKIYAEGRTKAIGVSNYRIEDIETILQSGNIVPTVNQVEFHPFLYRHELLKYCQSKSIVLEAHSPLTHGRHLNEPKIKSIADHYDKSPAQILIRWSLQHGLVVIPKTIKKERIQENINVFDFVINEDDMATLDALNNDERISGLSKIVGE